MKIAGVNAASCETTANNDYEEAEVAQETIYCRQLESQTVPVQVTIVVDWLAAWLADNKYYFVY